VRGIIILRYTDPHRPRPFRVPFGAWFLPMCGAVSCLGLIYYLPPASWWRFVGWLLLDLSIYASYGFVSSAIGQKAGRPVRAASVHYLAAAGCLLTAIGVFTIPHNLQPLAILRTAWDGTAPGQARCLVGLLVTALGVVLGGIGVAGVLGTPVDTRPRSDRPR
jgi:hypothetical protein